MAAGRQCFWSPDHSPSEATVCSEPKRRCRYTKLRPQEYSMVAKVDEPCRADN